MSRPRVEVICGHPDQPNCGHGLCTKCYAIWRKTQPAPCHPDRPLFVNKQCRPCYNQDAREAKRLGRTVRYMDNRAGRRRFRLAPKRRRASRVTPSLIRELRATYQPKAISPELANQLRLEFAAVPPRLFSAEPIPQMQPIRPVPMFDRFVDSINVFMGRLASLFV